MSQNLRRRQKIEEDLAPILFKSSNYVFIRENKSDLEKKS